MEPATRQVRRLQLMSASQAAARRGELLFSDALRTASLPDGNGSRLLLVRRLLLPPIDGRRPASAVSRELSRSLSQAAGQAVYALSPAADRAPAVYFHDRLEPAAALAVRLLREERPAGWFWALAVAGFHPGLDRDGGLRLVWRTVLQEVKERPAALLALWRAIWPLGRAAAVTLLGLLTPADTPALWRALGCSPPNRSPQSPAAFANLFSPVAFARDDRRLLDGFAGRWGPADERTFWLAALLLVANRPARLHDPLLPARALAAVHLAAARGIHPPAGDFPPSTTGDPLHSPLNQAADLTAARGTNPPTAPTEARPLTRQEPAVRRGDEPEPVVGLRPTQLGGLFFLLPVLARLQWPAFLGSHPHLIEQGLPERLLRALAARFDPARTDPLWSILPPAQIEESLDAPFVTPEIWREGIRADGPLRRRPVRAEPAAGTLWDGSGRLPLASWRGAPPEPVIRWLAESGVKPGAPLDSSGELVTLAWITALGRWCRRYAAIGLRDLVRRPAGLTATPTHLDLFFSLDQVDLRLRRTGLDLDPGWVPWLGRVVTFHYWEHWEHWEQGLAFRPDGRPLPGGYLRRTTDDHS